MKISKGEVWEITSRSFNGVANILEDIKDTKKDDFVKIKIVEGQTHYLGRENVGVGEEISIRTTLTKFVKQIK